MLNILVLLHSTMLQCFGFGVSDLSHSLVPVWQVTTTSPVEPSQHAALATDINANSFRSVQLLFSLNFRYSFCPCVFIWTLVCVQSSFFNVKKRNFNYLKLSNTKYMTHTWRLLKNRQMIRYINLYEKWQKNLNKDFNYLILPYFIIFYRRLTAKPSWNY